MREVQAHPVSAPGSPGPGGPGWLASFGLFLLFAALALGGLELWTDRFAWPVDPSWYRLEEPDGEGEESRVVFTCQNFAPVSFSKVPSATTRILLLGGSTAFGFPERPVGTSPLSESAHGIAGVMQATLEARWPGAFEVVNLGINGGTSEDSLRLARRAMAFGPSVLVVYDGNNELMNVPRHMSASLWQFALYRRLGALGEKATTAPGWVGPPTLSEPAAGQAVLRQFRHNLNAIADLALEAEIPLVLSTQAGNLSGFDPSWSSEGDPTILSTLHARSDAELEALWASIPNSADLAWSVGQRRLRAGQPALVPLQAAVDWDGMAFRATSSVNETIRSVAAERGATLVDASAALMGDGPPPGNAEFYDWVHPQPEATLTIGGALLGGVGRAGLLPGEVGQPTRPPPASPVEAGDRDLRVAVSWIQWACVRAHDPGFRLGMAANWAETAVAADPSNMAAPPVREIIRLLANPSLPIEPPFSDTIRVRLSGIHPCVVERLKAQD